MRDDRNKAIIFSCFEPFGEDSAGLNASREAVSLLPDEIRGVRVIKVLLPVTFGGAPETLRSFMMKYIAENGTGSIAAVICVGQASGRAEITPELIGVNYMRASVPDNSGLIAGGRKIITDSPYDGLFSTAEPLKMTEALTHAGYPGRLSASAGTYVCNALLYTTLYNIKTVPELSAEPPKCGFIHVPALPEQAELAAKKGKTIFSLPASCCASAIKTASEVLFE